MIELRTLGAVDLRGTAGQALAAVLAQPKRMALFVYLALARPRGFQRRDTLLALFWPEMNHEHARASLRKAVHVIRRGLGGRVIIPQGDEELGLAEGSVWCDAVDFERAIGERRLAEALDLYRGDLLAGFFISDAPDFEHWVDGERARLREQAAAAAWALAEQEAAAQHASAAMTWARRAMSSTSADEGALRRLMALLYRAGDRAAALHAYHEFATRLAQEYGVRPSAETRQLVDRMKVSGDVPAESETRAPPNRRGP